MANSTMTDDSLIAAQAVLAQLTEELRSPEVGSGLASAVEQLGKLFRGLTGAEKAIALR